MSPTTRPWVRAAAVLGVLLLSLLLVAACSGSAAPTPTTVAQAPTTAPADTAVPPTATVAPTDTPAPTATATEEPTPTAAPIPDATNCVTCHTNEATLQALAVEEEAGEALSEGEG